MAGKDSPKQYPLVGLKGIVKSDTLFFMAFGLCELSIETKRPSRVQERGCKPEPTKIPSSYRHPCYDGIQELYAQPNPKKFLSENIRSKVFGFYAYPTWFSVHALPGWKQYLRQLIDTVG